MIQCTLHTIENVCELYSLITRSGERSKNRHIIIIFAVQSAYNASQSQNILNMTESITVEALQ